MKKSKSLIPCALSVLCASLAISLTRAASLDTLNGSLANLYTVDSKAQTRSISPENFTGEKEEGGRAVEGTGKHASGELGQGWKVSPSVIIKAGTTFTLGEIEGPGSIQHIWMTPTGNWRHSILRFYWDGESEPAVGGNTVRSTRSQFV